MTKQMEISDASWEGCSCRLDPMHEREFVYPIHIHHNLEILEIRLIIMKISTAISILFATVANVHAFSVNQSQMIDIVSENANLSKAQAKTAVEGFVDSVTRVSFLVSINGLDPLLCTYHLSPIIDLCISFSVFLLHVIDLNANCSNFLPL
jgi:hypothetical protein